MRLTTPELQCCSTWVIRIHDPSLRPSQSPAKPAIPAQSPLADQRSMISMSGDITIVASVGAFAVGIVSVGSERVPGTPLSHPAVTEPTSQKRFRIRTFRLRFTPRPAPTPTSANISTYTSLLQAFARYDLWLGANEPSGSILIRRPGNHPVSRFECVV